MKGAGILKKEEKVTVNVQVPEKLAKAIGKLAMIKNLPMESLLLFWIEEGLERNELRFERMLLFTKISEEIDDETIAIFQRLKKNFFDEATDGRQGLDPYLVKSPTLHQQYHTKVSTF